MKKISDYMIISDMDGTLLGSDGKVPQRNIEAIKRFTDNGGRFGIATGRSRGLMREAVEGVVINAPCVLYNGGVLYDFAEDKMIMEMFLPESATDTVREIMKFLPDHIGVLVIRDDSYYQVKVERDFATFFEQRGEENFKTGDIDDMPMPWYKVLFMVRPEDSEMLQSKLKASNFPGVRFVATNLTLLEMLPEKSSKGYALQQLIDKNIVAHENLVTIGDYYNDLEMIKLGGIGVTLETSPQEIKDAADVIVGDCDGGAVADIIEHIENLCK